MHIKQKRIRLIGFIAILVLKNRIRIKIKENLYRRGMIVERKDGGHPIRNPIK
jgi:hypothetical protein